MPSVREIVDYLREVGQLRALLGDVAAKGEQRVVRPNVDVLARAGEVAWSKRAGVVDGFGGSLLLCPPDVVGASPAGAGAVIAACERPRLAMALVIGRFFAELTADRPAQFADPALAAVVAANGSWVRNARVAEDVSIAPHCVIGTAGMGYERDEGGHLVAFPQVGGVVIESGVDIAAHAMIQRAALADTIIRRGAKIGPHVNVGHNADIGEDVLITGHCQIAGGARIGPRVTLWQSAAVANSVSVGEGAVVGMGAMVLKDVPAGAVVVGNPARTLPPKS
jgi:acetyltransferase-like isoleucine patch superfamily enzyme